MHQTVKSTFSILSILFFFFLSTFVLSRIFFVPFSYQFLPRLQFLSLHHQFESYFIRDKIVSLSSVYSRRIPRRRIWELDFSFSRCREITPNFSRREYSSIMFTPASERSICFFFFYFLFSSSSFIFYSPPSSISSHVTYTYFIVENTRTSDHERQGRGRGKEKKNHVVDYDIGRKARWARGGYRDIFQREIGGVRLRYETMDTIYHRFA